MRGAAGGARCAGQVVLQGTGSERENDLSRRQQYRRWVATGGVVWAALLALPAAGFGLFEPDPDWKEGLYDLPPPPDKAHLRPFFVSATSPNDFMVDESTLSVGDDGVVRYVMVITTPGGAENVSFEGIRCASGEYRVYAMGRSDGSWVTPRNSAWRAVVDNSYDRPRAALMKEYFCDVRSAPSSREELLRRMDNATHTPV